VFPTMGLCNKAASTICDIFRINPSCDKKNAAAAALQQSVWYGHLLKIMGRRRFEKRDCFDDIDMPGGIVRVNSDDIAPAAPVARIVRDMSDGIDYALRQSLYQIPCRTATR